MFHFIIVGSYGRVPRLPAFIQPRFDHTCDPLRPLYKTEFRIRFKKRTNPDPK